MKAIKIGIIVVGVCIGCAMIAAVTYRIIYSQEVAQAFEVNSPELPTKVLIVTQGSDFKNVLVAGIIDELRQKPLYINVIDVSGLSEIQEDDWQAVVLINTCEMGKMQADAFAYLARAKQKDKIVLLTTSGSGDWKPEDVALDSISTASKKENINTLVATILKELEQIL